MGRNRKVRVWLSAIVGVLSITRAIVYFTQSDDHVTPSSSVSFDPNGGFPTDDLGLPTDVPFPTGVPTGFPTDIPSVIPSDAPAVAVLGPVRYLVTGNGATASVVEYTTADLLPVDVEHPKLRYSKTISGGVSDYFTVYAQAAAGTTITCEILAHGNTLETKQTAHGTHAHVSCTWQVPS